MSLNLPMDITLSSSIVSEADYNIIIAEIIMNQVDIKADRWPIQDHGIYKWIFGINEILYM